MHDDDCLLRVGHLTKSFRGLVAVDDYSLQLRPGEIVGIIGPNGAGKTTVFNLLTGYIRPTRGTIRFRGHELSRLPPDRIARLGIGRTFQNIRLFPSMSVLENVEAAEQLRDPESLPATLLTLPSFTGRERRLAKRSLEHLALFGLTELASMPATALSYGDQRRLEIVRALAMRPSLLLLDEPTAGMNPQESMAVLHLIRRIRDEHHLTIILVEHNMPVVMQLCERMQVLSYGKTIAEGTPEQIRSDPQVVQAYLGTPEADAQS